MVVFSLLLFFPQSIRNAAERERGDSLLLFTTPLRLVEKFVSSTTQRGDAVDDEKTKTFYFPLFSSITIGRGREYMAG